ncbi:MAG TPA: inositol monophosphatase family protein [Acetobacteraceae bacterium]|nr:inositol monophosphatase family protein [Acetobacteraceae bacterium]
MTAAPAPEQVASWLAAAEAAVEAAGAVVRPLFRAGLTADLKSDRSPVTEADRAAEQAMRAVIAHHCPGHGIIGEEFGETRPDARFRWALDPIDGTRAFITGRPLFGTLVGLLDRGVPVLGVIDQPVTGERWLAAPGRPTSFRGPFGGRAGGRSCKTLDRAELSCTSPLMFAPDEFARWQRLAAACGRASFGGDCYGYGLLALGQIDVIAEADLKVWDWAALVPVIEGAGGRMTDWQGRALREGGDGRALAVGDPALLAPALQFLGG